jgi:hypothetical protein
MSPQTARNRYGSVEKMAVTLIRGKLRKVAVLDRRFMLDKALELLIEARVNPEYIAGRGDKLKEIIGSKSYNHSYN